MRSGRSRFPSTRVARSSLAGLTPTLDRRTIWLDAINASQALTCRVLRRAVQRDGVTPIEGLLRTLREASARLRPEDFPGREASCVALAGAFAQAAKAVDSAAGPDRRELMAAPLEACAAGLAQLLDQQAEQEAASVKRRYVD